MSPQPPASAARVGADWNVARYGRLDFLDKVRDRVGLRPPTAATLHDAWVLVPSDDLR